MALTFGPTGWRFPFSSAFSKYFGVWLVVLIASSNYFQSADCFSPLWDSVKTQVFQEYEIISARGQISIVRTRLTDFKKQELVVGENVKPNSRLILTCTAWYPAEWVYSGDADPSYTSNTTIENLGPQGQSLPLDEVNGAKRYVATIVIGPRGIKQSDTGRYNCMTASPETGMKYKTLSAFYHLFVPGKTLFIRKRGGTILYDLRKSPARIPCGVTNPKVAVSLQKFQHGNLINVDNETMMYHPISGFYPRHDIPGTYVCTAGHNKAFELLHFTLVPKISDSGTIKSIQKSSEEDLEWLFNSFKLGQSNRLRLSTKAPHTFGSNEKKRPRPNYSSSSPTSSSYQQNGESSGSGGVPNSIWKRPSEDDFDKKLVSGSNTKPTYRPVYVLFAEDLNKLKSRPKERPSISSGSASASTSASVSGSDENDTEEDQEEDQEREQEQEEDGEKEQEESRETDSDREPDHQYHFDPQQHTINTENGPVVIHKIYSTQAPPTTQRPFHREYATTLLPFLNFLNPGAAVIKYKPVIDPSESIIEHSDKRRTTTQRPLGHIVYDIQSNRLVYQENAFTSRQTTRRPSTYQTSSFTKPTTERPVRTTQSPYTFRIPSLPTQRWVTTRRSRPPQTRTTTSSTTPPPPQIPEAVVCVNSPCGKHATCYANTVYYHKQKETRREPACKCDEKYYGNPYLECFPPDKIQQDFISFNNTGLFEKRTGLTGESLEDLEEGHLRNSDVFPFRSDEPVIVDAKRRRK